MAKRPTPGPATLAAIAVALVFLLLSASVVMVQRFQQLRDRADQTIEVEVALERSLRLLVDAETGQRGFVLTGNADYLAPYDAARRDLDPTLGTVETLVHDPGQRARLVRIRALAAEKLNELSETIELARGGERDRAVQLIESGRGKVTMDSIRALQGQMSSTEAMFLMQRGRSAVRLERVSFAVIAVAALSLLGVGYLLQSVRKELARREIVQTRVADLESFAGRVAHDVRSPLTTISLSLEVARRSPLDENARSALDRASRTTHGIGELVEGLLAFAAAGARPKGDARTEVRDVVSGVLDQARPRAEERGIDLRQESVAGMQVGASSGVLTSMVSNLVDNALKYLGEAEVKRVVVRARPAGRMARVEVEDTGPGVPRELRGRIFEPYTRAARPNVSGIGLGLSTVRRLAEAHGGSVGVAKNAGPGSLFWFEIPLAKPSREGATAAGRDPPAALA